MKWGTVVLEEPVIGETIYPCPHCKLDTILKGVLYIREVIQMGKKQKEKLLSARDCPTCNTPCVPQNMYLLEGGA